MGRLLDLLSKLEGYMSNKFDYSNWKEVINKQLDKVATQYMIELGYIGYKSTEQYEDIRDAFIVGYKRGQDNWLNNQIDWLDSRSETIKKEEDTIARKLGAISAQMTRVNKAKEELLKLKAALKEGFVIREVKSDD
jgi:hypothetical protein